MKKCLFCLNNYKTLTKEHIFPKSWYPDNFSDEKWKIYSCEECNSGFGKAEQEILIKVGVCSDPNSHQAKKAIRSITSIFGKNVRDKTARWKKACNLLSELIPLSNLSAKPFPNFGLHEGYPIESQRAIYLPKQLDDIGKKFIKGIEYKLENRIIDQRKDDLKIYFCHEKDVQGVNKLIKTYGKRYDIAPGIIFWRASGIDERKLNMLYKFSIWDKLIIYGSLFTSVKND